MRIHVIKSYLYCINTVSSSRPTKVWVEPTLATPWQIIPCLTLLLSNRLSIPVTIHLSHINIISPTEPCPSLHHIFGMICTLNSTLLLFFVIFNDGDHHH